VLQVTCPDCGGALDAGARGRGSVCPSCGWPDSRQMEDESAEQSKPKRRGRKRKKRQGVATSDLREGRLRLPAYAIGAGFLLLLWAGLAALSQVTEHAALWLAICGVVTTVIAVAWLYRAAAAEGAERLNFLNVTSRGVMTGMLLFLIEVIVMPVFCIVYLFLYFDSVWKPFVIELFGIGMCATGILLVLR